MKKQCPKCKNTYTNETLTFCLEDGARLVAVESAGAAPTVSNFSAAKTTGAPKKSLTMKYLALSGIVVVLLGLSATVLAIVFIRRAALERQNANVIYDDDRRPPQTPKDGGNAPALKDPQNSPVKNCQLSEADKAAVSQIKFDSSKFSMTAESSEIVKSLAEHLKQMPASCSLEIGVHTDSVGKESANATLSTARADALKDEMIKFGISAGKITAKGYGSSQPIADDSTVEGKAKNRRVEFKLFNKDSFNADPAEVLNLNDAKTLADLQSQGIEKVSPAALSKPNPLILMVEIKSNGDLFLNKEGQGNVSGEAKLAEKLRGVFSERENNGVYREGTNIVEKAVIIASPSQINRENLDKTIKLIKDSGANSIGISPKN